LIFKNTIILKSLIDIVGNRANPIPSGTSLAMNLDSFVTDTDKAAEAARLASGLVRSVGVVGGS
jgi:hypothetical protein